MARLMILLTVLSVLASVIPAVALPGALPTPQPASSVLAGTVTNTSPTSGALQSFVVHPEPSDKTQPADATISVTPATTYSNGSAAATAQDVKAGVHVDVTLSAPLKDKAGTANQVHIVVPSAPPNSYLQTLNHILVAVVVLLLLAQAVERTVEFLKGVAGRWWWWAAPGVPDSSFPLYGTELSRGASPPLPIPVPRGAVITPPPPEFPIPVPAGATIVPPPPQPYYKEQNSRALFIAVASFGCGIAVALLAGIDFTHIVQTGDVVSCWFSTSGDHLHWGNWPGIGVTALILGGGAGAVHDLLQIIPIISDLKSKP